MSTRLPGAGLDEECQRRHRELSDNINDRLVEFQDHAYARGMVAMKAACVAKVNEITKDWHTAGDGTKATAGVYIAVQLSTL